MNEQNLKKIKDTERARLLQLKSAEARKKNAERRKLLKNFIENETDDVVLERVFGLQNKINRVKDCIAYVYFIDDGDYAIKIGVANNVSRRLRSLQTSNPKPLKVIKTIECGSPKDAERKEIELHKQFAEHRLLGEWFKREPILEWVGENV